MMIDLTTGEVVGATSPVPGRNGPVIVHPATAVVEPAGLRQPAVSFQQLADRLATLEATLASSWAASVASSRKEARKEAASLRRALAGACGCSERTVSANLAPDRDGRECAAAFRTLRDNLQVDGTDLVYSLPHLRWLSEVDANGNTLYARVLQRGSF